ncbi:MAG: cell division protein FtsZ, partial [Pseudomonadota bacterium]
MPGLINLDFADIRTVMSEMGKAMMGTGEAEGPKRAVEAAEAAISNPLLDDVSMKGAKGVLINITGSYDMTLFEADEAASRIREEVDPNANIIFGATFNPALEGKMRVSVVATGIDMGAAIEPKPVQKAPEYSGTRLYGVNSNLSSLSNSVNARQGEVTKFPAAINSVSQQKKVDISGENMNRAQPVAQPKITMNSSPSNSSPKFNTSSKSENLQNNKQSLVFAKFIKTNIGALRFIEQIEEEFLEMPRAAGMKESVSRDRGFISPQAVQPVQRSFFSDSQESNNTETEKNFINEPVAKNKETQINSAISFLHKMANVGRVLASKPEKQERNVQVVEKPKIEVVSETKAKSGTDSENDYLEIPAFLRRQAN